MRTQSYRFANIYSPSYGHTQSEKIALEGSHLR
jgi:hypothetical protein